MWMVAAYRQLFADAPRARSMVCFSLLARLSTGAYAIPLVLLIQGTTHSYALAGGAEAANLVAGAVSGPARGRALDRFGSRVVIPRVALARAVTLGALWPVAHTRSSWGILLLAIVAGFAAPALPTAMRRQWQQLLGHQAPRLQQAYAFEVNAQVMVFVIGPLVAAAGLATIGAGATLAATGAFLLAGAFGFAALAVVDRQETPTDGPRRLHLLHVPGIATLALLTMIADTAIGVQDIAVTAFAKAHHNPGAAGLLLGLAALSAVLVGVMFGARSWTTPQRLLLARFVAVAAVLTAPLALARSIPIMAVLLVLASAPLAVQPIVVYQLLDRLAPRDHAGEALAWISTANSAGVGAGYLAAGAIIQVWGTTTAFFASAALLTAATIACLSGQQTLRPATNGS